MKYRLGDICVKIGSGATPKGGREVYQHTGVSLIRSQNVLDFAFSVEGLAHINHEQAERLNNVIVEANDVLLNITGDSVARACIVPSTILPARVNQHVAIVRTDSMKADNRYLLYYLQASKDHLLQIASAGATRNALTKKMIEDLEIDLPPLWLQRDIANTLAILDSRIEQNRKINNHLPSISTTKTSPVKRRGSRLSRKAISIVFSSLFRIIFETTRLKKSSIIASLGTKTSKFSMEPLVMKRITEPLKPEVIASKLCLIV